MSFADHALRFKERRQTPIRDLAPEREKSEISEERAPVPSVGVDLLRENDEIVRALYRTLHDGEHALRVVPGLVKRVIQENRWQERQVEVVRRRAAFDRFAAFVTEHPPEGLGADLAILKRICADDREALDLIDQATQNPTGRPVSDDTVNILEADRPTGNATDYALRKLRKDRPDLHAEVIAGIVQPDELPPVSGHTENGETPLDDVIAGDLAAKHSTAEIEKRIARCEHYASLPTATPSDVEAVNDWRRILAVKAGTDSGSPDFADPTP